MRTAEGLSERFLGALGREERRSRKWRLKRWELMQAVACGGEHTQGGFFANESMLTARDYLATASQGSKNPEESVVLYSTDGRGGG